MSERGQTADLFRIAPSWSGRGRAFLRFLAFCLLFCLFTFVPMLILLLLSMWRWHLEPDAIDPEWAIAMQVAAEAVGALGATWVMARIGKRRLGDFGFGGGDRWRHFLIGIATGAALLSLLVLALRLGSAVSLEPTTDSIATVAGHAAFYALVMVGIAFAEESSSRGYALVQLSQSVSFWPAALLTGAAFGLMHSFNGGETATGVASAAAFGILLAYSYRRTGSLWLACGIHAGWDYGESFLFGVPNSGLTLPGGLFEASAGGPQWLTGGSAGPEGSLLMLLVFAAMLLVIRKVPTRAAGADDTALDALAAPTASR